MVSDLPTVPTDPAEFVILLGGVADGARAALGGSLLGGPPLVAAAAALGGRRPSSSMRPVPVRGVAAEPAALGAGSRGSGARPGGAALR